jgi:hypothetical protein
MASGTSLSGYVFPITGVTLPASTSSLSTIRSALFGFPMNVPSFCPDERGQHERPELAIDAPEPSSAPFATADHEGPPGGEGSPKV